MPAAHASMSDSECVVHDSTLLCSHYTFVQNITTMTGECYGTLSYVHLTLSYCYRPDEATS